MAILTVFARQVDPDPFQAADAGGDSFRNDGETELLILNAGVTPVVVTAVAQRRCNHGFLDDWEFTVAGQELQRFGPFEAARFNDSNGRVTVTYADESDLTVAAQRQR